MKANVEGSFFGWLSVILLVLIAVTRTGGNLEGQGPIF